MRTYNIIRFGQRIRYAEVSERMKIQIMDCVSIPASIPKVLDPFICVFGTANCEQVKHIEIQDKSGKTWFEVKSNIPIKKVAEYSSDLSKEMR
jgi:hypothetical protein